MLDLLRDRHRSTVVAFLQGLPDTQRVELVAMDMWRPYKEAVNLVLPNAQIVVDKFHVLRLRRRLMHDRFLLLKRRRDLTPQQELVLES